MKISESEVGPDGLLFSEIMSRIFTKRYKTSPKDLDDYCKKYLADGTKYGQSRGIFRRDYEWLCENPDFSNTEKEFAKKVFLAWLEENNIPSCMILHPKYVVNTPRFNENEIEFLNKKTHDNCIEMAFDDAKNFYMGKFATWRGMYEGKVLIEAGYLIKRANLYQLSEKGEAWVEERLEKIPPTPPWRAKYAKLRANRRSKSLYPRDLLLSKEQSDSTTA